MFNEIREQKTNASKLLHLDIWHNSVSVLIIIYLIDPINFPILGKMKICYNSQPPLLSYIYVYPPNINSHFGWINMQELDYYDHLNAIPSRIKIIATLINCARDCSNSIHNWYNLHNKILGSRHYSYPHFINVVYNDHFSLLLQLFSWS